MSTQTKKIKDKINPPEEKKKSTNLKPSPGRDMLLLVLIAVTVLIMALGWSNLDTMGITMYSTMLVAMVVLYINRHVEMNENIHKALTAVTLVGMAAIFIMMIVNVYTLWQNGQ